MVDKADLQVVQRRRDSEMQRWTNIETWPWWLYREGYTRQDNFTYGMITYCGKFKVSYQLFIFLNFLIICLTWLLID